MTPMCALIVSIALAVVGQLLMKLGIVHIGGITLETSNVFSTAARIFSNPTILVGLAFYGASAFLWLVAISRLALSVAYPMVAVTYVLVPVLSVVIFGEELTVMRILAMGIIVVGIVLVSRG